MLIHSFIQACLTLLKDSPIAQADLWYEDKSHGQEVAQQYRDGDEAIRRVLVRLDDQRDRHRYDAQHLHTKSSLLSSAGYHSAKSLIDWVGFIVPLNTL